MGGALDWMPVAAAVFAVPQFLPQMARVWRSGDTAGVSWPWAALTSVSNGGWIAYFALSRFWTALVAATSVAVLAGLLAVLLGRRGGYPRRAAAVTAGWAALLGLAGAADGRAGLGTALATSFVLQVTPSVWTAYRTKQPTGISSGTWLLILAELLCWGVYGVHKSDPRLVILGCTGVAASVLMLARANWRRPRRQGKDHRASRPLPLATAHRSGVGDQAPRNTQRQNLGLSRSAPLSRQDSLGVGRCMHKPASPASPGSRHLPPQSPRQCRQWRVLAILRSFPRSAGG